MDFTSLLRIPAAGDLLNILTIGALIKYLEQVLLRVHYGGDKEPTETVLQITQVYGFKGQALRI